LAPPLPNVGDQPGNRTRAIDLGEADVDQMLDVARKASASVAAQSFAESTAAPSRLTLAACSARRAASAGSPAATMAQPSMKICARRSVR